MGSSSNRKIFAPQIVFASLIILRFNKHRQDKWLKTEYDELFKDEDREQELSEEFKLVLEPVVFQGTLENQIRSLYNNDNKERQVVLICSKCTSHFHNNHLLDWLKDNPLCPVYHED